jgi:hypothetical protein
MEWVAKSSGMCYAPTAFKRMMNDIMHNFLHKFVTIYRDDVFVYIRTPEEHLVYMRLVLQRLKEEGLKLYLK